MLKQAGSTYNEFCVVCVTQVATFQILTQAYGNDCASVLSQIEKWWLCVFTLAIAKSVSIDLLIYALYIMDEKISMLLSDNFSYRLKSRLCASDSCLWLES